MVYLIIIYGKNKLPAKFRIKGFYWICEILLRSSLDAWNFANVCISVNLSVYHFLKAVFKECKKQITFNNFSLNQYSYGLHMISIVSLLLELYQWLLSLVNFKVHYFYVSLNINKIVIKQKLRVTEARVLNLIYALWPNLGDWTSRRFTTRRLQLRRLKFYNTFVN